MSSCTRLLCFSLHLIALLGLWAMACAQHRPVEIAPDALLTAGEKFNCLSYAPYHLPGQTPLNPDTQISRAQIEADLAALASVTHCVRIYAVNQGLEVVPEVARELGLKVLLGAWVGYEAAPNRKELETAIALAKAYPDVVRGLVVGNEVMLRGEQSEAALKALLDEARQRSPVPVTYADVWEFWLRHPDLVDSVDFITVHILPYWEDEPVAVEAAVAHAARVRQRVLERYGKPVLIGETGWPGAGRQRAGSKPGKVEEARYLYNFVREARRQGWDYNLIEAIDQPWKRDLEGTVGGYWGVFDADLQAKFPLHAAFSVTPRPSLLPLLAAGALGILALAALYLALYLKKYLPLPDFLSVANMLVTGAWIGSALLFIGEHGIMAYRNLWEWSALGLVAIMGAAFCAGQMLLPPPDNSDSRHAPAHSALSALALAILLAAFIAAVLLLLDPRYRDFPVWLYLLPLPALLALPVHMPHKTEWMRIPLSAALLMCGLGSALQETGNNEAYVWAALCLLLALAGLRGFFHRRRTDKKGDV
ncbi:MAG: beta-1,6-glucan synthase [Zoogloeaceae bacterium]|jgi:glucan 1,3-beta-glucosidase|nr:beta-1,6-glucan synthase [Zoogloeaceae bacterium]